MLWPMERMEKILRIYQGKDDFLPQREHKKKKLIGLMKVNMTLPTLFNFLYSLTLCQTFHY